MFRDLPERLAAVRACVAERQSRRGWTHPVRIVAVTKGWGPEAVRAARAAGLTDVGENRVQEAMAKQDATSELGVTWHLVGHLQSNKARQAVTRFALIHSVDSIRLGAALDREAEKRGGGGRVGVLLQVNVAREAQKFGCDAEEAPALAADLAARAHLELRGLMAMAPFEADEAEQRRVFGGLSALRERLAAHGLAIDELSMGMSQDYEVAVEEGATILRLGTVLFGERPT